MSTREPRLYACVPLGVKLPGTCLFFKYPQKRNCQILTSSYYFCSTIVHQIFDKKVSILDGSLVRPCLVNEWPTGTRSPRTFYLRHVTRRTIVWCSCPDIIPKKSRFYVFATRRVDYSSAHRGSSLGILHHFVAVHACFPTFSYAEVHKLSELPNRPRACPGNCTNPKLTDNLQPTHVALLIRLLNYYWFLLRCSMRLSLFAAKLHSVWSHLSTESFRAAPRVERSLTGRQQKLGVIKACRSCPDPTFLRSPPPSYFSILSAVHCLSVVDWTVSTTVLGQVNITTWNNWNRRKMCQLMLFIYLSFADIFLRIRSENCPRRMEVVTFYCNSGSSPPNGTAN